MDNIWQETIERVCDGARFTVDFETRSLKVDGKFIIQDGKYEGNLGLEPIGTKMLLEEIEYLYQQYKHSIPSERTQSRNRNYFRALPEHKLEDDDMLYADPREVAQVRLELYILISILNGSFKCDEVFPAEQWFWQSNNDRDLVILQKWINK